MTTCKNCGLKKQLGSSGLNKLKEISSNLKSYRIESLALVKKYFDSVKDTTLKHDGIKRQIDGGLQQAKKAIDLVIGARERSR